MSFSANRVSNYVEQKPVQAKLKGNSSSDSFTADRSISKAGESLPDGFPQSRESTNLAEKVEESSISRPRQGIIAGVKSVPCQKCKDTGHSALFCVVDDHKPLAQDVVTSRSSKEEMDKGNKLKAAIEAAMPKKLEIYRKNRVPDQSDEVSASSINCEVSLQDSSNSRKLVAGKEVNEGLTSAWNSNAESTEKMTDTNAKQIKLNAEGVTSGTGNDRPILPVDGKPFMKDLPSHASVATSAILMMSAIPEHEYIWQYDSSPFQNWFFICLPYYFYFLLMVHRGLFC